MLKISKSWEVVLSHSINFFSIIHFHRIKTSGTGFLLTNMLTPMIGSVKGEIPSYINTELTILTENFRTPIKN